MAGGDDGVLIYAALELRMTIEAIAYDKLRIYAPRLPAAVLDRWQPPQAIKALLEFEPHAESHFRVRICAETEFGVPSGDWLDMGEHRSLKLRWVRKAYHKLGSYLHAPSPSAAALAPGNQDMVTLRSALDAIVVVLRPVVDSTIESSVANTIQFDCTVCGAPILRNAESATETHKAVCLQPTCAAEHSVSFASDGSFVARLEATEFECLKCDHPNTLEDRKLDVGYRFTCRECGVIHAIASRQWAYAPIGATT